MFGLGLPELLIIGLLILLFFGAKRLPDIGSGLGKTVKEVRHIKKELKSKKKSTNKTESAGQDPEAKETSVEDGLAQSLESKIAEKVMDKVPVIGQAKKIKDKAEKIRKIVS